MSGKYQSYSKYKDSGVNLLGELPFCWHVLRYKNILKIMQGMAFKSSEYVDSSSVINIRMGNIKKGGDIDLNHNIKYLPEVYKKTYKEYELQNGDSIIAMTDMSPTLDFLAVPAILKGLDKNNSYLLNQRVGKLLINSDFDIHFIRYLLLSNELRTQLKSKGLGTVQANMSNDDLYSSYFFCPSEKERNQIVNFLDHETAKIDTLIERQQQLIKLLKEKRQAVISYTVTKGLNSDALMRDSGVEWLGKVPEQWLVTKLKRYCHITDGSHHSPKVENDGEPFISVTDVGLDSVDFENCKRISNSNFKRLVSEGCKPNVGDILLTKDGTIGRAAIVKDTYPDFVILSSLGLLSPSRKLLNKYLYYYLISGINIDQMNSLIHGSALKRMTISKIDNLTITIPSKNEQSEIIDFLDDEISKIDNLIDKANSIICITKERRSALISSAVTGKIDVRNWQPPESANNKNNKEVTV